MVINLSQNRIAKGLRAFIKLKQLQSYRINHHINITVITIKVGLKLELAGRSYLFKSILALQIKVA